MPFGLTCEVCEQPFGFFENLNFTLRALGRCAECDQRLQSYQEAILAGLEQDFQERTGITKEIEAFTYGQLEEIEFPNDLRDPIIERLSHLRLLSKIREGDLPHVSVAHYLDTDEYAHFAFKATYLSVVNNKLKIVPGNLIGTSKKIYFITDSGKGSATLSWQNVSHVRPATLNYKEESAITTYEVLRILVSQGKGGGDYDVPDRLYAQTIMEALIKQWRRQLAQKRITSGYVPDYIKAAVYQRDGGQCVECGYTGPYLEYDHVYPRSKGGQTSIENIQLLCGQCNRKKGNKV